MAGLAGVESCLGMLGQPRFLQIGARGVRSLVQYPLGPGDLNLGEVHSLIFFTTIDYCI